MQTENHKCGGKRARGGEELFDIQAVGMESAKHYGELGEAKFVVKATSMGFGVAKPCGEERYDFIVNSGYRLWRVQVKSTWGRSGKYKVSIGRGQAPYDETQIDFLAVHIAPEEAWYVIPVKAIKKKGWLNFYPRGRGKGRWERYREGWCLMACPYDEDGPSKIVTPRCRDKGPGRFAICPLKMLQGKAGFWEGRPGETG